MVRKRPDQGWRAAAFAVALFAITLNFFQPLAHAVLMRDGGPEAAARTWGVFCLPGADEDGSQSAGQQAGKVHECCLGLAQAPVLAEPSVTAFLLVEPVVETVVFAANDEALAPVGIRDGPHRPRGPPSHV
ncbi:DUF2946 family protein [Reyranella sp.]|uniref:DUF2946 family protein n=1 Tax=Reyranella sp. TaxID=1929291 RepID=UPI003C7A5126